MRRAGILFFFVLVLAGSLGLHYVLPNKKLVIISGIDSKRRENIPARTETSTPAAADLYFIFIKTDKDQAAAYRNENTGWGWPPYFKFDATELQAKAQTLVGEQTMIRYYGWRNKYLGLFPNITSLEKSGPDASTVSWVRRILFTVWFCAVVYVFSRFLGLFGPRRTA